MRPCATFSWTYALREHGPGDRGWLLTMLMLSTWMDADGNAYLSQRAFAKGARCSVKTVQRHVDEARRLGWLVIRHAGRGGQGWRCYEYRCTLPDGITLTPKHEKRVEDFVRRNGPLNLEGADIQKSPPTEDVGGDKKQSKVATRVDVGSDTGVQHVATQPCPPSYVPDSVALSVAKKTAETVNGNPESQEQHPAERLAEMIGFREQRADQTIQQYAIEVAQAQAMAAA